MKLEVTARFSSNVKPTSKFIWIIFLILYIQYDGIAQDYKLTFGKDIPLSEALLQSSRMLNFRVAFDAQRLQAVNAKDEANGNSIEEFLSDLLKDSGFKYLYKHGSYLIIRDDSEFSGRSVRECQLTGSVIDSKTGEQLPFASIKLPDQSIGAMASTNGTFSIKNIVSNPVQIIISYIGYHTLDTLLNWTNPNINVVFRLKQEVTKIGSVDVIHSKSEIVDYRGNVDFATTINPAKLVDMPALVETDIFRTLQLLPGICYSESSSELSIRGGTSDQNLILFDGQTLYNLSHYYGVFSSINPNIVKDIQVYKGGFDSRYGERISGIVDITGKSGNQMKPAVCADINLLNVNLAVEIPVTKKLTFLAAGRRSYSDIYSTSFADNLFNQHIPIFRSSPDDIIKISEPSFYFYDINGKLNYRISNNENISISVYGGKDFYENSYTYSSRAMYVSNSDSNSWKNYGISANWQKQWSSSFFSSLLIGSSGYTSTSSNNTQINRLQSGGPEHKFLPDSQNVFKTQNLNELKDLSFSIRNTYDINSFNQFNFGFLIRKNDIFYHKDAGDIYIYDNTKQTSWISSLYAQDRLTVSENLVLKPGFRISYYAGNRNIYLEPRFAANLSLSENFSCRMATGLYNQFISQVMAQQETGYNRSFWVLTNDSVNPVLKAKHLIIGATYNKKKFTLDVEGYYKHFNGIQEYIYISQFLRNTDFEKYFPPDPVNPPPPGEQVISNPSYFITGSGKSYGIDFFVSYKGQYYTNWLSYSLSKSVHIFDMINYGEEIPSLTDQTHQVTISNLFTIGKWNLGAILLFSTGRPFIVNMGNEMQLPIIRQYDRLPNYFRCDISANYNFLIKSLRIKTGVSVINLFNNQNYLDVNSRTFNFDDTSFSQINLIQSQKLSLNVFLHISL
jgi:ferric enterobactin receptor